MWRRPTRRTRLREAGAGRRPLVPVRGDLRACPRLPAGRQGGHVSRSGTSRRARAQEAARAARLRQMEQERRRRRQRTAWISAVAVTVLLVAGLTGAVLWQASRPGQVAPPAAATADGAGLPVGSGPVTVEVYLDFLCPHCADFEAAAGPVLREYVADGTATVVYRPVAILDRNTTTEYSTRAAAAAACAAGSDQLAGFVAAMLENQPLGQPAGLTDDQIVALGA